MRQVFFASFALIFLITPLVASAQEITVPDVEQQCPYSQRVAVPKRSFTRATNIVGFKNFNKKALRGNSQYVSISEHTLSVLEKALAQKLVNSSAPYSANEFYHKAKAFNYESQNAKGSISPNWSNIALGMAFNRVFYTEEPECLSEKVSVAAGTVDPLFGTRPRIPECRGLVVLNKNHKTTTMSFCDFKDKMSMFFQQYPERYEKQGLALTLFIRHFNYQLYDGKRIRIDTRLLKSFVNLNRRSQSCTCDIQTGPS